MMRVGIDIEEINRFKDINCDNFCKKYLTDYETDYVKKKGISSLAGIYCAKESFLKALGVGIGCNISLKSISIKHNEKGKPYFEENENLKTIKEQFEFVEIDVSISHTSSIATAICVIN